MGTLEAIVLLIPPLVLIAAAIVVVKARRPWIRVFVLLAVAIGAAYVAFSLGSGITRARFMSSHIHWFRDYSAHLNRLAEQDDPKELRNTVRLFDGRFRQDPWSATNIQDIMYQILKLGPYVEIKDKEAPNQASEATSEPAPSAGSSAPQG